MVDLDELDRLHASLPELEPQTQYQYAVERGRFATQDDGWECVAVICEAPMGPCVDLDMYDAATNAVVIINAYPEVSAELKGTRKKEAEALLALAKVADLLSANGCDCECGHHYEEHDDDCDRCFACRIEECFTRPIRDAIHEVQR